MKIIKQIMNFSFADEIVFSAVSCVGQIFFSAKLYDVVTIAIQGKQ